MERDATPVVLTVENEVAYLSLENPPYNILTCEAMTRIGDALETVAADATVKALAVTARGKAFSAGADVGEHTPEKAGELIATFGRMFRLFRRLEIPVVMAVEGTALGAGFELVLVADLLLAGERAKFGQPEIRLGFFAPLGVVLLPELVGPAKAAEITASGRTYSAAEMEAAGLVNRVVPAGETGAALEEALDDFRKASPLVLRMNMRLLRELRGLPFEEALDRAEGVFLNELMKTEDVREGIASFFENRPPRWKNR